MWKAVLFTLYIRCISHVRAQTCYTYNGTNRESYPDAGPGTYAPCADYAGQASMCCRVGWDDCVAGGLCYNHVSDVYWRESCTDITWSSPNCIKLFVNGTGDPGTGVDVTITNCGDGSWCFGSNNTGCCAAHQGYFIKDGEETLQNPNQTTTSAPSTASTSSLTSSPTSTTSTSSLSPTSHTTHSSSKLSGGAIAGIVIGVIAALVIVIAFGLFSLKKKKLSRSSQMRESNVTGPLLELPYALPGQETLSSEAGGNIVYEKEGSHSFIPKTVQLPPSEIDS